MGVHVPLGYGMASLAFACSGVTDQIITTFGYENEGSLDPSANAQAIRVACAATAKWLHPSQYSNQFTFLRVDVVQGNGDFAQFGTSVGGDLGIISPMATVPVNSALLVRKGTARGGRRGRGRMYLPPAWMAETDVAANGSVTGASFTSLQTKLTTFLADLDTAGVRMVLLHESDTDTPDVVTSLLLQPLLATQRRRMR